MKVYSTYPTRKILDGLSRPDDKLKIIHIAGTNGKGSTAEFFTNILTAANKKTGTYTSPAVYGYYDQFKINGVEIDAEKFTKYFAEAAFVAPDGASEFEIQTTAAIYAFFKEGCEYAVIECGMGGLNDATNAINKKQLAVITSVSLEHTDCLGTTLKQIFAHKAGIIKNCPAVACGLQQEEVRQYLLDKGAFIADGVEYFGGKEFTYRGKTFSLSAEGCYQPYNAATAIAGARILNIDEAAIEAGVKNTAPLGRVEVIERGGKTFVLDGAHNPAAFAPLCGYLKNFERRDVTIIFGCLSDKDMQGNLAAIFDAADKITAVDCPSPRASGLEKTTDVCRKFFKNVSSAQSVADALGRAATRVVAVCGSFTLLKEAKLWIEKKP